MSSAPSLPADPDAPLAPSRQHTLQQRERARAQKLVAREQRRLTRQMHALANDLWVSQRGLAAPTSTPSRPRM
jgi:hypothetical protein